MITIGITGGSGCGKSTVSEIFKREGAEILDGDVIARRVVEPGNAALDEIVEFFGSEFLADDGTLNRRKLGEYVFSNPKKLEALNRITHKYIAAYIDNYIESSCADICVIDAAALIESGISEKCDYMICVIADSKTRIKRIGERDNLSFEDAKTRIDAQKPDEFYIKNCDYVIYNNGNSFKELDAEVKRIITDIRSRS